MPESSLRAVAEAELLFLNWTAPSTLHNKVLTAQAGFVGQVILGSQQSIGCVLNPTFSYKSGNLWLLEQTQLKSLAMTGVNVDCLWVLAFKQKNDSRESRPCVAPGKVILRPQFFVEKKMWISSGLIRKARTEEVDMPPAKNMVSVEEVGSDVLPSHTEDGYIQGARKSEQIGVAAHAAVLDLALDGVTLDAAGAFIMVD